MLPPHRKLYLIVATFFWGILLSYIWVAPGLYDRMSKGYADFSNFYTAGKIVQIGQGHQLYDPHLQVDVQTQFSDLAVVRHRALPYMRPPFEALLFLPLSYLSFARAYAVWVLVSVLLVGVTGALLRSRIPDLVAIPWWVYYPGYFSFCPIFYGFVLGQDSALMLLLFGWIMVDWLEGRDFRAGCFLGLALMKFQLVLPLVFILCVKRQFRTLAGFSLVAAVLSVVSIGVAGWDGVRNYPAYLWHVNEMGSVAGIYPSMMPSLRGLVQGWTDPLHTSRSLDLITAMLALGVLVWASMQWRVTAPRSSKVYSGGIAIAFLATLLAGYHEFSYDLSLLYPVVLRTAHAALHDRELDHLTRWTLMLGAAVLLYSPLYLWLIGKAQLNLMAVAVLVLAWGLARAVRIWQLAETVVAPATSAAA
jgi:hypothetical protein